jgi:hypothetical protein
VLSWWIDEIAFADANWAPDLNNAVKAFVNSHLDEGYEMVTGIASDFFNHGWCADNRYVNTATDSINRQGDDAGDTGTFAFSTTGLAHPNADGYAAVAARILDHLDTMVENEPPVGVGDKIWAGDIPIWPTTFNVLDNDYDPDPDDTLFALLDSQPAHGTVSLLPTGLGSYKPKPGYSGPDSFRYIVSDGIFSRYVTVTVDVQHIVIEQTKVPLGASTEIGGLLGGIVLQPPYAVEFDIDLDPERGTVRPVIGEDKLVFTAPPTPPRRRSIRLPYRVYSLTTDITSPDYGRSVPGVLKIRLRRIVR